MVVDVVKIGDSKGIRIPESFLDQCEIAESVEVRVVGKRIVLTPPRRKPRQGWEAEARQMHDAGNDQLLIPDVLLDDPEIQW